MRVSVLCTPSGSKEGLYPFLFNNYGSLYDCPGEDREFVCGGCCLLIVNGAAEKEL